VQPVELFLYNTCWYHIEMAALFSSSLQWRNSTLLNVHATGAVGHSQQVHLMQQKCNFWAHFRPSSCGALEAVKAWKASYNWNDRSKELQIWYTNWLWLVPTNWLFMAALCNRGGIIFLSCDFFLLSSSFFFFSSPNRSCTDWTSTILRHMVWPQCEFRMQVWNVLHAARWKCRTQKIAISAPSHNFVSLYFHN